MTLSHSKRNFSFTFFFDKKLLIHFVNSSFLINLVCYIFDLIWWRFDNISHWSSRVHICGDIYQRQSSMHLENGKKYKQNWILSSIKWNCSESKLWRNGKIAISWPKSHGYEYENSLSTRENKIVYVHSFHTSHCEKWDMVRRICKIF